MGDEKKQTLGRRDALGLIAAGGALVATGCVSKERGAATSAAAKGPGAAGRMPVIFLAHGSPMLLDDRGWMAELSAWANAMPRPRSVLMLSAHWEERPVTLGATRTVPLVYDFYNFPERYYRTQYPSPGAPELAARVRQLLDGKVAEAPTRGLDHGAYVPLVPMYPNADVPVLQVSLPSMQPQELWSMGEKLASLRDEGVLIVGSGFLTHNLRLIDWGPNPQTPQWASEFDAWSADVLARRDVDALLDYRAKAPGVRWALPTHEHFVPVITAMAAATDADTAKFPITGFMMGSATKRSVQFG